MIPLGTFLIIVQLLKGGRTFSSEKITGYHHLMRFAYAGQVERRGKGSRQQRGGGWALGTHCLHFPRSVHEVHSFQTPIEKFSRLPELARGGHAARASSTPLDLCVSVDCFDHCEKIKTVDVSQWAEVRGPSTCTDTRQTQKMVKRSKMITWLLVLFTAKYGEYQRQFFISLLYLCNIFSTSCICWATY